MGVPEANTTLIYGIHLRESANDGSDFTNAAADYRVVFLGEDGELHKKDSAGAVTDFAGTGIAASLADTAGDMLVASGADAWAKLAMGAAGGHVSRINGAVAWNSGTANPGSAAAGDRFWRTDLGLEVYYDGTRWLTTQLFREPFAADMSALPAHTGNDTLGRLTVWHTTYDLWLVTFYSTTRVSTTNNGTNFWTVTLNKTDASNSSTSVASFSTGTTPDAANTWITRSTAIGAVLAPATHKLMKVDLAVTLAPGSLLVTTSIAYRLIIT